jgi:hypothetical protein
VRRKVFAALYAGKTTTTFLWFSIPLYYKYLQPRPRDSYVRIQLEEFVLPTPDYPFALSKTFQRRGIHTEISPLRCASVEMTKGRSVLPGRVVAEQKPFFITLVGPKGP